jgi:hypothetical protein
VDANDQPAFADRERLLSGNKVATLKIRNVPWIQPVDATYWDLRKQKETFNMQHRSPDGATRNPGILRSAHPGFLCVSSGLRSLF